MDTLADHPDGWTGGMKLALEQAKQAFDEGEIPVGAVLLDAGGDRLAAARNQSIRQQDPSAHAEIQVLRRAARVKNNYRLPGTVLITTVEPCLMCAGALVQARIAGVIFGTADPKAGAIVSRISIFEAFPWLNHRFWIRGGLLAEQSRSLLQVFFAEKRKKNFSLRTPNCLKSSHPEQTGDKPPV